MTLQILVNHYNEDINIVKRFLDSLQRQKDIRFEVIIASDGGNIELTKELFSNYNFQIEYYYLKENRGVCCTRNFLLDKSSADYIMFCDIDDIFEKEDGLKKLLEKQADIIGSPFFVEKSSHILYNDILHVHGKAFKRDYIINNNIRFPDEMKVNGDMMFLWLAYALTKDIIWIDYCFYTWKYNPNSVTQKDNKNYSYKILDKTIKCYDLLGEDLKKRNRLDLYQLNVVSTINMIYIFSTLMEWEDIPIENKKTNYIAINNYLQKIFEFYKTINQQLRQLTYNNLFNYYKAPKELYNFDKLISWGEKQIKQTDTLIIGYGIVGKNLEKELKFLEPDIYDKYNNYYWIPKIKKYKVAFICVPTPKTDNKDCDILEVRNAILENDAELYVIKSTVLPGTIDKLIKETGKHIVFSPEYYGETQHCNNYDFNFTILGGDKQDCINVQQILQKVYDGRHKFYITDGKTAELAKYMENSYLATKVSFCNQFFNIAKEIGVNYEELRELFILDPRVNPSHTFVYQDKPYWDSKCLNKDVVAIANTYNAALLKNVINFNNKQKKGK